MEHIKDRRILTHEELPQGSDAWKAARIGRLSGTKSKTAGSGAKHSDAINNTVKLLNKELDPSYVAPNVNTPAMQHGTKYEPYANNHYIATVLAGDEIPVSVGLVQKVSWSGMVILSPDQLIAKTSDVVHNEDESINVNDTKYIGACEYKCRSVKEFDKFAKSKVVPTPAMHQIRHYFLTMDELEWVDYAEYNPHETEENCMVVVRVTRQAEAKKIDKLRHRVDEVHNIMYNATPEIKDENSTSTEEDEVEVVIATPETVLDTTELATVDTNSLVTALNTIEVEVLTHLGTINNIPDKLDGNSIGKWVDIRKKTKKLFNKVNKTRLDSKKPITEFLKTYDESFKSVGVKLEPSLNSMDLIIDAYEAEVIERQTEAETKERERLDIIEGIRITELSQVALPMEIELLDLRNMHDEEYGKYLDMYTKRGLHYTIDKIVVNSEVYAKAITKHYPETETPVTTVDNGWPISDEVDQGVAYVPNLESNVIVEPTAQASLSPAKFNEYLALLPKLVAPPLPAVEDELSATINATITKGISDVADYLRSVLGM